MKLRQFPLLATIGGLASACSPPAPFTQCKSISRPKAVGLAVEQKRGMLSRSVRSEQDNFASDAATVAEDPTGYAAKVSFRGKDGRALIGLIDEDCYVGWTIKDRLPPPW